MPGCGNDSQRCQAQKRARRWLRNICYGEIPRKRSCCTQYSGIDDVRRVFKHRRAVRQPSRPPGDGCKCCTFKCYIWLEGECKPLVLISNVSRDEAGVEEFLDAEFITAPCISAIIPSHVEDPWNSGAFRWRKNDGNRQKLSRQGIGSYADTMRFYLSPGRSPCVVNRPLPREPRHEICG